MERRITEELIKWKEKPTRKPLMVYGVRKCGKTYSIREFGEKYFTKVLEINFSESPSSAEYFEKTLEPEYILKRIEARFKTKIDQNTLIFFDDIEMCPKAITSLKYFCEDRPDVNIICAGSYIKVTKNRFGSSFPVGKVNMIFMKPMDFREYLTALGKKGFINLIEESYDEMDVFADCFEEHLKDYLFVGGMPEAVNSWINERDFEKVVSIQNRILSLCEKDFIEHAPDSEISRVKDIWKSIPEQLINDNTKFMFGQTRVCGRSRELWDAVEWLIGAELVYKVRSQNTPNTPIAVYGDLFVFKLFMCDTGLLMRSMNVDYSEYYENELKSEIYSAIVDNYVLNELISAYGDIPHYWKDTKEEVDFIIEKYGKIIPIEVNTGKRLRRRTLKKYIKDHNPDFSIIYSLDDLKLGNVLNIPLYAVWITMKILEDVKKNISEIQPELNSQYIFSDTHND